MSHEHEKWLSSKGPQITNVVRMLRKGNPCTLLVQPLWKTVWRFLKKLNIEHHNDPGIPLLDLYPKYMKTILQKDTCTPVFRAALFATAKTWKPPKSPSTDEWIKRWGSRLRIGLEGLVGPQHHKVVPPPGNRTVSSVSTSLQGCRNVTVTGCLATFVQLL